MSNSTTMSYGGVSLIPVPFMSVTRNYDKTSDDTQLSFEETITLNGTLTPFPTGTGGIQVIDTLQDNLRNTFRVDGQRFLVQCGASTLYDVYPKIQSINFPESTNNWVMSAPYTVELGYSVLASGASQYISQASEEWNIEVPEDQSQYRLELSEVTSQQPTYYYNRDANSLQLRVSHVVSAVGKTVYDASGIIKAGWQQAQDYVTNRMGFDASKLSGTDFNFNMDGLTTFNHVRTRKIGELDGSYDLTESWLVINPTGSGVAGNALEDFTIDVREGTDDGMTTVGINGTIRGLETVNYGTASGNYNVSTTKYANATGYWDTVKNRLYSRVQYATQNSVSSTRSLNISPRSTSVGHNPPQGTLTYTYEYDDRPSNCIAGALSEVINVNDVHPTDVFASLTVIGRSGGPILQDIGTVTAATRDVNIEAVMEPPTGCTVSYLLTNKPTTAVNALLCLFETDLKNNYAQVFKHQDTENWSPKNGRYSRNVSWTYQASGVGINTSVC